MFRTSTVSAFDDFFTNDSGLNLRFYEHEDNPKVLNIAPVKEGCFSIICEHGLADAISK